MPLIGAVTLVAFVALAVLVVEALGPILGAVAWLLVYGVFRGVCAVLLRWTDPDRAYAFERATPPTTGASPCWRDRFRRRPPSHTAEPF